jgi:hypothetical protein
MITKIIVMRIKMHQQAELEINVVENIVGYD